jgi:hypothetical protein
MAKEQGGVIRWKITKRKHQGQGGCWLNRLNKILVEDRPD